MELLEGRIAQSGGPFLLGKDLRYVSTVVGLFRSLKGLFCDIGRPLLSLAHTLCIHTPQLRERS